MTCDKIGTIQIATFIPPEGSAKEGLWRTYSYMDANGQSHGQPGVRCQNDIKYWQKIHIPKEFNKKKIYSIIAYSPDKKQIYPFVFTDWNMAKAKEKEMINLNYKVNFEQKEI